MFFFCPFFLNIEHSWHKRISVHIDSLMIMFAVRELDVPGEIYERKTYPFEFSTVEMPYETYNGVNVRLRYVCSDVNMSA